MRYIKLTFQYLRIKKLLVYLLLAVLPAIAFVLLGSKYSLTHIIARPDEIEFKNFSDILNVYFGRLNAGYIWALIFLTIICAIFLAFLIGTMDRDMRIGDFRLQNFGRRVNYNFFISLLSIYFVGIIIILYKIVSGAFYLLWIKVLPSVLIPYSFIITSTVLFILMTIFFVLFALTPIIMVNGGQRLLYCIGQSIVNGRDHLGQLLFAVLFPIFIKFIFVQLLSFHSYLSIVFEIVLNALIIVYVITLIFVAFYDINDLDRKDLKAKVRW